MGKRISGARGKKGLPRSVAERLTRYHYYLKGRMVKTISDHISSGELARYVTVDDSQVRRDLESVGVRGSPRLGCKVADVIASVERESVARLCNAGYRIEHWECAGQQHSEGAFLALPYALAWLQARVAGDLWPEDRICNVLAPVDCTTLTTP